MRKNPNILDFKQELKKNIPQTLLIAGEDPTLGDWAVSLAKAELKKQMGDGYADHFFVYVGSETDMGAFHSEFFNLPLFGGNRVFVIKEAQDFFKKLKSAESGETKYANLFAESLKTFPDSTKLIMIDSGSDTPAWVRKLFPELVYFRNRQLYENEWGAYIQKTAEDNNIKIDNSAVDFLVSRTQGKPNLVRLAMTQLTRSAGSFPGGHVFNQRDLTEIIDVESRTSIFRFIEDVLTGKTEDALRDLPSLELGAETYLPLMTLLLKDTVRLRRLKDLQEAGMADEENLLCYLEIPRKSPFWQRKRLEYYGQAAARISYSRLGKVLAKINHVQLGMKGGLKFPDAQQQALREIIFMFAKPVKSGA